MKKITLGIDGMTCSACSNTIEKYVGKQNGVISCSVNLVMANATIEYDESLLSQRQIEQFIKQAGYKSTGIYELGKDNAKTKRRAGFLIFYGVLTLLMLYLTMGAMIGIPLPSFLNMKNSSIAYTAVVFALTIAFLAYGMDIFIAGIRALFHRSPSMDTLVTVGVLSSFAYSIYAMVMVFLHHAEFVHQLYFESCAVIIYFIKLGRFLDSRGKAKTREAIQGLVQITPKLATLLVDGQQKQVTIDEVKVGDTLVCLPGERFAVDGTITRGNTHVDQSFITGESKPITKSCGDWVVAGSINYDGYVEYQAQKIGRDSTISEIVNLVVEATNTKMPIAKTADKVSGIFVPCIMAIALATFVIYLSIGQGLNLALTTFVTVLVVACPCALGLATPLAVVISEGKCASSGILVKSSQSIEIANKIDTVVLDKTGTITHGKPKIFKLINYSPLEEKQLLQLAAALEGKSSHPLASAFTLAANDLGAKPMDVVGFKNLSGMGVSGKVDGKSVAIGNAKLLEKLKIENTHSGDEQQLADQGCSIAYMAVDKKVVALFGITDTIKEDAAKLIGRLLEKNIDVIMLTGDNKATAAAVGKKLGITKIFASVLPSQKTEIIKALKLSGHTVMMIGDGINDSPALASADIGVSVHSGTDIAMNSADVILMQDDLTKVLDLMLISKKTISNIKQNLFWAFFYNGLMIPIAVGAFRPLGLVINPMIAGLAMVLSSLTVVLNALLLQVRLNNKKEKENVKQDQSNNN